VIHIFLASFCGFQGAFTVVDHGSRCFCRR